MRYLSGALSFSRETLLGFCFSDGEGRDCFVALLFAMSFYFVIASRATQSLYKARLFSALFLLSVFPRSYISESEDRRLKSEALSFFFWILTPGFCLFCFLEEFHHTARDFALFE